MAIVVVTAAGRRWSKSIKIMRGCNELSISRAIEHSLPHCILGEKVAIANNPQGLSCSSQCDIDTSKVLKESKGAKFTSPIGIKSSDARYDYNISFPPLKSIYCRYFEGYISPLPLRKKLFDQLYLAGIERNDSYPNRPWTGCTIRIEEFSEKFVANKIGF